MRFFFKYSKREKFLSFNNLVESIPCETVSCHFKFNEIYFVMYVDNFLFLKYLFIRYFCKICRLLILTIWFKITNIESKFLVTNLIYVKTEYFAFVS